MNLELKLALVTRGIPAYQTAKDANIPPNRVYRFVAELSQPSQDEKDRLAEVLERPTDELFPKPNPNPPVAA